MRSKNNISDINIIYSIFFFLQEDLSDFEDIFKNFGYSVPALTNLRLQEKINIRNRANTEFLKPYFPKIKNLVLLTNSKLDGLT